MARTETWFDQDLKKPVSVRIMSGVQFSEDNQGSLIGVRVYDDGADATLTGGATGYCILADGQTITVDGTREGNMAYILLPQSALLVPGPIQITIKLVDDGVITTLLACVGTVIRTKIGVPVVPASVIEEWSEQISETLQDCVDDCQAAADAMGANLAAAYSSSATYPVGSYVIQSGTLYRCTTAVTTAGSWSTNSGKFTAVKLGNDVADLKSALYAKNVDTVYVYGKAYRADTNTESSGAYHYAKYQINDETEFVIYGHAFDNNGKWPAVIYLNSNNEVIKIEKQTKGYYGPVRTVVPENAAWLIVNGEGTNGPTTDPTGALIYESKYGLYADDITRIDSVLRDLVNTNYVKTVKASYVIGKAYRADTNDETSGDNYQYAKYQIDGEMEFIIYGHSYGGNGKWPMIVYLNSDNETIETEYLNSGYYGPVKTTVPNNASWIIVNGANTGDKTGAMIYKPDNGLYADDIFRIENLLSPLSTVNIFDDYTSVLGTIVDGYARKTNGTDTSNDNYVYGVYSVTPGDKLLIAGYHYANTYPLFLVYDSSDTLLTSAVYDSASVYGLSYIVPDNASYIIVNGNKATNKGGNGYPDLRKLAGAKSLHSSLREEKTKRRYLFMGDSYCAGYTHGVRNAGWGVYCAEYMGLSEGDYVKSAVAGSKFRTYGEQYINNIPVNYPADYFTDIVLCGGYNDRFDIDGVTDKEAELLSGMENVCAVFKEKYPYAKIHIGFIAYSKQGTGEGAVEDWLERRNVLINNVLPAYQKCTRFGAAYLTNVEYWINDAGLSPEDGYHPNEAGNRSIGQAVAHALLSGSAPLPHNEAFRMPAN